LIIGSAFDFVIRRRVAIEQLRFGSEPSIIAHLLVLLSI